MDKQKTQRIIGILVIIAFVIVLIPLFFGKTDVSTQVTSVKAPPLPAQQPEATTNLAKADVNEGQTPDDSAIMGSATPVANPADAPQPATMGMEQGSTPNSAQSLQVNTDSETNPANGISNTQNTESNVPASTPLSNDTNAADITPAVADQVNSKTAPVPTEIKTQEQASASATDTPLNAVPQRDVFSEQTAAPAKTKKHKIISAEKKQSSKVKPLNLSSAQLAKLTTDAWAIQMGNFKDKENARRLADKLRVAGYKAFTKEIKSAKGNVSTRVYIGPEFKQASALQLSNKIEQEMKIHGIIVSIKPLEI